METTTYIKIFTYVTKFSCTHKVITKLQSDFSSQLQVSIYIANVMRIQRNLKNPMSNFKNSTVRVSVYVKVVHSVTKLLEN